MQVLEEREDGLRVLRVLSAAGGDPWRASFAGAYQAVWGEPPYNERFFPDEAEAVFRRAIGTPDNITLLAVRPSGMVAGFAVAYPLTAKPDVVREIRGLLPIENTYYLAELGVLEQFREQRLGSLLFRHRTALIDRRRYMYALARVSAVRDRAYDAYLHWGFEDTGVYTEVLARRNDGTTRTDRRVYLSRVLAG